MCVFFTELKRGRVKRSPDVLGTFGQSKKRFSWVKRKVDVNFLRYSTDFKYVIDLMNKSVLRSFF